MNKLGLIGGMDPESTIVYYVELVYERMFIWIKDILVEQKCVPPCAESTQTRREVCGTIPYLLS